MLTRRVCRGHAGFTLIELLVAIAIMALMAVMSWRGIDGMVQTQTRTQQRGDEVMALQMGMAQWSADLDAMEPVANMPGLEWDGRVLRLVRRGATASDDSLRVVAWSRRVVNGNGMWLRWQSSVLRSRGELENAWQQASLWAQNPDDALKRQEVAITPLAEWQIFYFRQNAWTHPLSSDDATAPGGRASVPTSTPGLPEGIRLVLTLPSPSALAGVITRDWVRPTLGGNKS
jgi:general secretion pathway protein J